MPPRQRSSKASSGKPDAKKSTDDGKEPTTAHARSSIPPPPPTRERGVRWSPVFKRIGVFVLILAIPAFLNYVAVNQEARVLMPQDGVTYDIGWGQKLFMRCEGSGRPTVILDAPIGQTSVIWFLVQPLVAKHTKVCVYDRAGLGFSDRAYQNTSEYANDFSAAAVERDRTQPSTIERMADDLHRLISYATNQPKPVLLVSSDFTTLASRFYAQLYEHEVAGLLLIDPAVESLFEGGHNSSPERNGDREDLGTEQAPPMNWSSYWYRGVVPHMQGMRLSATVGFNRVTLMLRLMSPVEEPELKQVLPDEVITMKKHLLCNSAHMSSVVDEYYFVNESMSQLRTMFQVKPFPSDLPVTIATYKGENENLPHELVEAWTGGHKKLFRDIHPRSRHIVLPGSDYLASYYQPQSVASAILSMVERWRRDTSAKL